VFDVSIMLWLSARQLRVVLPYGQQQYSWWQYAVTAASWGATAAPFVTGGIPVGQHVLCGLVCDVYRVLRAALAASLPQTRVTLPTLLLLMSVTP
jgi:hypothetical protein